MSVDRKKAFLQNGQEKKASAGSSDVIPPHLSVGAHGMRPHPPASATPAPALSKAEGSRGRPRLTPEQREARALARDREAEKGRAVNRLNALKHAMTSKVPIIPGLETEEDWDRHLEGVRSSLAPEGYLEEFLTRRIAFLLWRFDRITNYEISSTMGHIDGAVWDLGISAQLRSIHGHTDFVDPEPEAISEAQQGRILPPVDVRANIMRHETGNHRLWIQTQNQLFALQARRRGEHVPMAFVDYNSPPNMGPFRTAEPVAMRALKDGDT
jgi:hypothetical protein